MYLTKTARTVSLLIVAIGLAGNGHSQTVLTNTIYDVSRDFSLASNPNGVWSYGWKSNLTGAFTPLTYTTTVNADNGVPIQSWSLGAGQHPLITHNATTNTAIGNAGQEVHPPGSVMFTGGFDGWPQNFGVIQFTVPDQGGGIYKLESAVRCYLDGDRSGDTDYHVVVNGTEIFGQFLPPRSFSGYTNIFTLSAGDTVDFMVGRGTDGLLNGSGLKIAATLSTPPPQTVLTNTIHDISRDFSLASNPNGVWSYGWKSNLTGGFSILPVGRAYVQLGVPFEDWVLSDPEIIQVYHNPSINLTFDNGEVNYPPGIVALSPGVDGSLLNFCVIRFTVPSQGSGQYRLESSVESRLYGGASTDSDYHVVVNQVEAYGVFLPPNAKAGYTNDFLLNPGDTVDFICGRGADGTSYGGGLKLKVTFIVPPFCTPHKATATPQLMNGIFVGATITDPGCGYTNAPTVLIQGGGGTGATATALISAGQVTGIHVSSGGCCYTNAPKIVIGSPPFVPTVSIAVSKVKVTQNVVLGRNYVLESSPDLVTWTATGPQFTAESETIVNEFDGDVTSRFFQVRQVP